MAFKSREAGREIYEDREYVRVFVKGQPQQVFATEVNETWIKRFPQSYAAFKQGLDMPVTGTPIDTLPGLGPSMVVAMKAAGVRTWEDLAALGDEPLMRLGTGARALQARARALVSQTSEQTTRLASELDEQKRKNDELRAQMEQLQAQVQELAQRRGPGRPRNPA